MKHTPEQHISATLMPTWC